MTPETKTTVRAAITINGMNGALLGGHGALSCAPAAGLYQVILEQRIASDSLSCVASLRGGAARLTLSMDPVVQNVIEIWVTDDAGKAGTPTSLDILVVETV